MQNLWNEKKASAFSNDSIKLAAFISNLLEQSESIFLCETKTSIKAVSTDLFGNEVNTLYLQNENGVCTSELDFNSSPDKSFIPIRLDSLLQIAKMKNLSDSEFVTLQRASLLNPNSPIPPMDAMLHAIIPFKYINCSYINSVLTLANTTHGREIINKIYGDSAIIVNYIKPGFDLTHTVFKLIEKRDLSKVETIILLNSGVITFADKAKTAYSRMIDVANKAENYLKTNCKPAVGKSIKFVPDTLKLAQLRKQVSQLAKKPVLALQNSSALSILFSNNKNGEVITNKGPLCPDHVAHTKPFPLYVNGKMEVAVKNYGEKYSKYYQKFVSDDTFPTDSAPKWSVWPEHGTVSFGHTYTEAQRVYSIVENSLTPMVQAEALGGWKPVSQKNLFDVENSEIAKSKLLKSETTHKILQGKVAIVTGAAAGIGLAIAKTLHAQGAVVVGLDRNPAILNVFNKPDFTAFTCDITDKTSVQSAVDSTVQKFGGLDIVVSNAGIFTAGKYIEELERSEWDRSLNINLTGAMQLLSICIPYLKLGIDPSIVMVGSRNVTAPGAGAAAYSVAKAGLFQLSRIAALELCKDGVRINTIHPDAVFDTELWTPEALKRSADRYGLTVEQYKTKNLMKTEITSNDVAQMVLAMTGPAFAKTTGAAVPVDGGNDRVI